MSPLTKAQRAAPRCTKCGKLILGQIWSIKEEFTLGIILNMPYHFSCASEHKDARSMILGTK